MTLRNLLLRAYPHSWRDEYGAELAGILAWRSLTPAVVADVLSGAARQHLYRDEPWKICGAGLFLWNLTLLLLAAARFFTSQSFFLWCYSAGFLFLFATGAWTALRNKSGRWKSVLASAEAALAGHLPDLLGYLLMIRRGGSQWIAKSFVVTAVLSLLFCLAGALAARCVAWLRKAPPATQ